MKVRVARCSSPRGVGARANNSPHAPEAETHAGGGIPAGAESVAAAPLGPPLPIKNLPLAHALSGRPVLFCCSEVLNSLKNALKLGSKRLRHFVKQ